MTSIPINFEEVRNFITNTSQETSIYIGCDSQVHNRGKGKRVATFARTIIVHIDSKHGCKVFGDTVTIPDYGNIRQRLMHEVTLLLELFEEVYLTCGERPFELHLDVNTDPSHKSNEIMREAYGYVRGVTGLDPKFKPEAFAASSCADRRIRHNMN